MAKDSVIQIRVSEEERAQIEAAAAADDRTVSNWARRVLSQAAKGIGRGAAPSEATGDCGGKDENEMHDLRYEPVDGE